MKSNIWLPVTVVIGFLFAVAIVCVTLLQIKKLEFAHKEIMADKELTKEILNKQTALNRIYGWNNIRSIIKGVFIEICPGFITKFLGF